MKTVAETRMPARGTRGRRDSRAAGRVPSPGGEGPAGRGHKPGPVSRAANVLPRRQPALPFVLVNMAMTADGKIATANRQVSSFGSARDHEHLLELRAMADAVMAGARTVDLNPVNLGPGPMRYRRRRLQRGLAEYNLRVLVSGSGTVDLEAEVFRHKFSPIIVLVSRRASKERLERLRSTVDAVKVCGAKEIDFRRALRWLRAEWGVRCLLCEGGGELNAALWRAGLVDELHLTVCPKIFGGRRAPTIADGIGARSLAGAISLELRSAVRRGGEMFLIYSNQDRPGAASSRRAHNQSKSERRLR